MTIQLKATGQYFLVMLMDVVVTLSLVNAVLNESYCVTVSFDTVWQMKFGNKIEIVQLMI